ncbi:MAG: Hydrogenase maturation factor HypB [Chroococcidiopsis cubana SAG 39.79]|uniref:Hydrogenase nickel incorporation protein HypB n=2 Tax=Chroococcidiopsis TaxID=54298 RepID=K9TXC4_CHRTP|nr:MULTISPECIES: hydrogenase nickel incorporation protein HypB [Chroococcidiopsis]PSB45722.1 hydrogenase accessory protein HypB [Cyanosarcina cf. burmensis CCALA 770]AFY87225.1 Hydrogenase nickel incorporation protein HypB [Chroococcidiopsis thermalis PCC 7203]MDZ4874578.1 Hydrogenase maturation factor HypB [Chroococcidiopsis cubana SAG 39.79]PSB55322.1 hydrogenase accessory protein HypB [Chroococcidiopsis cubana CCALA 043]RUT10965.1 hydrogenase accessory protein HypB [Chroococcidiopsis cubana
MHQTFDAALGINLLHANQEGADHNRTHFDEWGITCFNVMSSPGAGKTVLLEKTLAALKDDLKIAVIEGDMTTELDADRLRQYNVPVIAINTGRSCHLDSKMVAGGIHQLEHQYNPADFDLVLVENVGNLVCPAEFEVGEHAKVALLSVTEGEDKPLKYPIMFREADCLLITKIDLAIHLDMNIDTIVANVRQINPNVKIIPVSAKTGEGLAVWFEWVRSQIAKKELEVSRIRD